MAAKWKYVFYSICATKFIDDIHAASTKRKALVKLPNSLGKGKVYPKLKIRRNDLGKESGFALDKEDMRKFHIWPSGVIPYYIDDFSFDKALRDRLRLFLENANRLTGLQFVEIPKPPLNDERERWVMFINRKGLLDCADYTFKNFTNEGVQRVVLGYHCLYSDDGLADLILSLVGVPPQHTSPNRDKYISVKKENILPDKLYLFDKLNDNEWLFFDLNYDYSSAGHYENYKYTLNGNATYEVKDIAQVPKTADKEKGFTGIDILKIKMLYNYISRNRETSHSVSECSKLFIPSSKLTGNIESEPKDEIKPWPKPKRYLGETDKIEEYNTENNDEKNLSDDIENMSGDDALEEIDSNQYDDEEDNDENDQEKIYSKENQTESTEITLNNNEGMTSESNEDIDVANNETKIDSNETEYDYDDFKPTTQFKRVPLAYKVDHIKQKLLGQSDYETGDEGDKKYIHEKNE